MTAPAYRPPEFYILGESSPVVILDGPTAAWLENETNLPAARIRHRGGDFRITEQLNAVRILAARWCAATGTPLGHSPDPEPPSLVTTEQAADLMNITPRGVRAAITAGRLPAERHGRQWLVARADALRYRAGRAA